MSRPKKKDDDVKNPVVRMVVDIPNELFVKVMARFGREGSSMASAFSTAFDEMVKDVRLTRDMKSRIGEVTKDIEKRMIKRRVTDRQKYAEEGK